MLLLRNKLVKSDFFSFSLLQATAERPMGGGFWRNSDSELKLKNRCTGSTYIQENDTV